MHITMPGLFSFLLWVLNKKIRGGSSRKILLYNFENITTSYGYSISWQLLGIRIWRRRRRRGRSPFEICCRKTDPAMELSKQLFGDRGLSSEKE